MRNSNLWRSIIWGGCATLISSAACSSTTTTPPISTNDGGVGNDGSTQPQTVEIFSWWNNPGEVEALNALLAVNKKNHPNTTVVNSAAVNSATARDTLAKRLAATPPNPPD